MAQKQFHILLQVPETFDEDLEKTLAEIDEDSLLIAGERKRPEMWAGLEWAIPGLIAVFFSKAYFEGFLQEMGKAHYVKLNFWLKRLVTKSKDFKITTIASSVNKVDPSNSQSKAISIFIDLKNGQKIKLLFDEELTLSEWHQSIDEILELVINNYDLSPNDELTSRLIDLRSESYYMLYGFIDRNTKKWKFIDDLRLTSTQINPPEDLKE